MTGNIDQNFIAKETNFIYFFYIFHLVDKTFFRWVFKYKKPGLNNKRKKELRNIYEEDIRKLEKLTNKYLNYWYLINKYKYKGRKKGRPGDVPKMLLSIEKIKEKGWTPKYSIKEAVVDTLNYLK